MEPDRPADDTVGIGAAGSRGADGVDFPQPATGTTSHARIVPAPEASIKRPQTPMNPPQSAAPPQRVRVSQGVMAGMVISKVPPVYPADAKAARIQGQVVLKVVIGTAGDVQSVDVLSGDSLLAGAAIDAVKQWKYRPYILNGTPETVETTATIVFTLAGG